MMKGIRQVTLLFLAAALLLAFLSALPLDAQNRPRRAEAGPAASLSLILGRPTDRSIALNVLSASTVEARVEYGDQLDAFDGKTETRTCKGGVPSEFSIGSLKPNTSYRYRLQTRSPGDNEFRTAVEATFRTQRPPGSTFAFALQGDSHPEREGKMYDPALYAQTMRNVMKEPPDFYITMGDDFSIERLISQHALSQNAVDQVYAFQRTFLGVIGQSAPLFLVNGNHEQAALCNLDGTPNNAAVYAGIARTRFFPLPSPDAFYGGNREPVKFVELPRDYYAWTWGDALFVVIDPYWHSSVVVDNEPGGESGNGQKPQGGKQRDLWQITLGDAQYRWLTQTLTESKARWKFVFSHHVLGTGRGGIECAPFYEWGGKSRNGRDEFAAKRPGWAMPIHQLMVKTGVTIFFQGHDHLFARQKLDGIIYQSCPNPADSTYQAFNRDAYLSGDVLANSGHLRVAVSPAKVRVEYVRSYLPKDATIAHPDGEVAFAYEIPHRAPMIGPAPAPAQPQPRQRAPQGAFQTDVPQHPYDVILGRPTAHSITLSVLCYSDRKAVITYGTDKSKLLVRSPTQDLKNGVPSEIILTGLKPDTQYYYQLRDPATGKSLMDESPIGAFHTQRAPGSGFTFTIQADSHLDENCSTEVYRRTLGNVLADSPDFHIDLGDTFMNDKHVSRDAAAKQYLAQRYYLGMVGIAAPVFLVVGGHDGETPRDYDGTANSLAVWSNTMRKRYFPSPLSDGFYSGDTMKDPFAGVLQDYYAWTWGDALFVVLDPYWHGSRPRGGDNWSHSLGLDQYKWLAQTLEKSKSKYKFLFIHNLVGGVDNQERGGAEAARLYEWGGRNADGTEGFRAHRPGWEMPIHDLLVRHHVTAVFHGHDHFYAKQELDGIVYQLVPQPGYNGPDRVRNADQYGYKTGDFATGAGHLRVKVSSLAMTVDFLSPAPLGARTARQTGARAERTWTISGTP
jgi:phosphodiesterase/alkaline phosphatase D-like protein